MGSGAAGGPLDALLIVQGASNFGPLRFTEIEQGLPSISAQCWPNGYADFNDASSKRSPEAGLSVRWPAVRPLLQTLRTGSPVG